MLRRRAFFPLQVSPSSSYLVEKKNEAAAWTLQASQTGEEAFFLSFFLSCRGRSSSLVNVTEAYASSDELWSCVCLLVLAVERSYPVQSRQSVQYPPLMIRTLGFLCLCLWCVCDLCLQFSPPLKKYKIPVHSALLRICSPVWLTEIVTLEDKMRQRMKYQGKDNY